MIKDAAKRYVPVILLNAYRLIVRYCNDKKMKLMLWEQSRYHKRALSRLKNKEKINCVFFAIIDSVWKYDKVYRLMAKNERFEPIILVCPMVTYGEKNMLENMDASYNTFKKKGYNVIKSYNPHTKEYIDVKKDLLPDIIFYTNPYHGLIDDRYFFDKYKDVLTVYVPYFFSTNSDYQMSFNVPMHNSVWRRYLETETHKAYAVDYSLNKGRNVVVSGAPGIDDLINANYKPQNVWLDRAHAKKRIIWAPHHTIIPVGVIYYSCFLEYADLMLNLAEKYKNHIEICFKPHPLLRNRLNKLWGQQKTDEYYGKWVNGNNTFLSEGQYIDLFLTSDAMIHDSASFIVEYLYTNKPVLRTLNGENLNEQFSEFGFSCLECHYKSHNEQDIERFIQNVINEIDPMKEQRAKFVNNVLMPKGSPSQNIIDDILDSIDNQILYRN